MRNAPRLPRRTSARVTAAASPALTSVFPTPVFAPQMHSVGKPREMWPSSLSEERKRRVKRREQRVKGMERLRMASMWQARRGRPPVRVEDSGLGAKEWVPHPPTPDHSATKDINVDGFHATLRETPEYTAASGHSHRA